MIISITELDTVAVWSRLHSEQLWTPQPLLLVRCAKDSRLFSANQAPHIELCITNEGQNIERKEL